MQIASIPPCARGVTDRLLADVTQRLTAEGFNLVGALRAEIPADRAGYCDSALRLLPDGPVIDITQDLGKESSACRMDAGALEQAAGLANARLAAGGVDLVVLNKFGLSEAEGRGFRAVTAEAVVRDIPVLVGLSEVHRAAFDAFAEGLATELPPDEAAILAWCRARIGREAGVAGGGEPKAVGATRS